MPAPLVPVIDNFNRTEASLSNAGMWTAFRGSGVAPEAGATNGTVLELATAVAIRGAKENKTFTGHQQVAVTITEIGNKWIELWMSSASGENGYSLEYASPTHEFILLRNHATQAATKVTTFTLAAGDKIFLDYVEATGVVTAWFEHSGEWKEIFKFTDGAPITGGGVTGFAARTDTNGWKLDDFRSGAVAEASKPATQNTSVGTPITTIKVTGSNLATMASKELPAGIVLTKVSETEWTITGTPTTAKGVVTVTLEPKSGAASGEVGENVTFSWTVTAKPKLTKPADQVSTQGSAITPFTVSAEGANLTYSIASGAPAGTVKINAATGEVTGTPSTVEAEHVTKFEIVSANGGSDVVNIKWTVNAGGVESAPTITKPIAQTSREGTAISTLKIVTTNVTGVVSSLSLPAGLTLTKIDPTESQVTGTPTTAKTSTTVEIKAKNIEGAEATTIFSWFVEEAFPTVTNPGAQSNEAGVAMTTLKIKGTKLATLTSPNLPAGLTLTKVNETEWTITGTPSVVKGSTSIELRAENKETDLTTINFNWTITGGAEGPKSSGTGSQKFRKVKNTGTAVILGVHNVHHDRSELVFSGTAEQELTDAGDLALARAHTPRAVEET